MSLFAASGTATKSDRESAVPCVFWNSLKNWKRLKKYKMLKSYRMCRFLLPPGRQQFGSPNLRYLVFFFLAKILRKINKLWSSKIVAVAGLLPLPFRRGLATSWHHFTWPPPQHPATQRARGECFVGTIVLNKFGLQMKNLPFWRN